MQRLKGVRRFHMFSGSVFQDLRLVKAVGRRVHGFSGSVVQGL